MDSLEEYLLGTLLHGPVLFSSCPYARGMCFVNLAYLKKKNNIQGDIIRYIRKKTGQQLEVRITERMQAIIDSFAGDTVGSPYVFSVIRDSDKPAYFQYESGLKVQDNRLKRLVALTINLNMVGIPGTKRI